MLRTLIDDVPSLLLVLLTVILTVSVVFSGVWLVRRFVPVTREGFDAEVSSQILGVAAALFGLFLAFVIVIEFQNFDSAQGNVGQEADSLAAITRDSRVFPPTDGNRVRSAVGAYVREVVNDEWPRMHHGRESESTISAIDGMYAAFHTIKPRSPEVVAFYDDSVKQLNQALISRRQRISDAPGDCRR